MPELSRAVARSWSSTLKLPKSTFPPRVSAADQAKYLTRCSDDLYAWQRRQRAPEKQPFVLHDGPPYANGDLHIGHALNKILKDIICRVQLARGRRVDFVPGWDCHGLPIELKALQQQKELDQFRAAGKVGAAAAIRKAARQLAARTVSEQMTGFRKWAVMGDWANAYKTMDKGFEMKQLEVFLRMVEKGLIYRRFKPVYWSPSSRTALAEAELEYTENHKSTAAFVKYPLTAVPEELRGYGDINAVIWTTTPWTLPANRAIAVSSELEYSIVKSEWHGNLLVASSRVSYLEEMFKDSFEVVVSSISGSTFQTQTTYRPLFDNAAAPNPVIVADFVTADSGSGLVHCAPGHGMEDYEVCLARGIDAFAPVNDEGMFTPAAMPSNPSLLSGKSVLEEGNWAVLKYVESQGQLLAKHRYEHKYPYDWRSKLPVIVRATEQWFADVGDIRGQSIRALEDVHFIPSTGKSRLESFVKNRSEWCISRQRAWGVPIPALYHRETGEAALTKESVSHIMKVIDERGIDAWWTDAEDDPAWILPSLMDVSGPGYKRGTDTMDVWFDSGTSWTQIDRSAEASGSPADVYLEGTDQHRGWFQSGLLTYIAHQVAQGKPSPEAPFKTLITHGFTLDHEARKMSKSIGNVINPDEIMNGTLLPPLKLKKSKGKTKPTGPVYDALGADALRLWVAGSDYTKDIVIGQQVLKSVNSSLHKFRVTFKLLLGALQDFQPSKQLPYTSLHKIDKVALLQLRNLVAICHDAYGTYEFHKAVTAINKWANLEFSAFYVESLKDRLYAESGDSLSRLAAQTTLLHIYFHLQGILAPLVPLLVEESLEHTPEAIKSYFEHPLQRVLTPAASEWANQSLENNLPLLMAVNSTVKTLQETARSNKQMGSSLQSFVHLSFSCPATEVPMFEAFGSELQDLFVVSSVSLSYENNSSDIPVEIQSAEWSYNAEFELPNGTKGVAWVYTPQENKCERCWRYKVPIQHEGEDQLCVRCEDVVRDVVVQGESQAGTGVVSDAPASSSG
ncbi:isoleucine-tRNA ligase [Polytolypa hystricis UAMH7299]|uniref:Isoleucine--tRNA ligase, mitochondrial n=1 Tax=Polytolypa hystricis (strain UAMH7299) TaxID=1447883 RepID=A0A2B7Z3R0_POLH7|nr:isoleucine-tRNA ligase [Polytolypa hystricis UAMH7299]